MYYAIYDSYLIICNGILTITIIVICILTILCCIFEYIVWTVFYTSLGGDVHKKQIILDIFKEHWQLKGIKFEIKKKKEEEYQDDTVDPTNQNTQEVVSMVMGNQMNHLLNNYKILVPAMENKKKEEMIWKIFSRIWKFGHVSHVNYTDENIRVIIGVSEVLGDLISECYNLQLGVPHYLHYFYHLPDFMLELRELGCSLSTVDNRFGLIRMFFICQLLNLTILQKMQHFFDSISK